MQPLSPQKYIETRARTLPVTQCLVNSDWQQSRLANVVVVRSHVNGHITAGIYLVDLLCLGVKDTLYVFNEDKEPFLRRFTGGEDVFGEISYPLAHNIIFAGHDFAMEYGITPHRDFQLTRLILAEDNDQVPLLDIPVGAPADGLPHLVVSAAGQHADALALLRKNAGEGGYHYTIGG